MTNVPEVIDLYTLAHTRSMCVVSIEKKSPESEKIKKSKFGRTEFARGIFAITNQINIKMEERSECSYR